MILNDIYQLLIDEVEEGYTPSDITQITSQGSKVTYYFLYTITTLLEEMDGG